jgi:hypothetical protein
MCRSIFSKKKLYGMSALLDGNIWREDKSAKNVAKLNYWPYHVEGEMLMMILTAEAGGRRRRVEGAPTQNRPAKAKQSVTKGSRGDDLSVGVFSWPPLIIWGTAGAWWARIVRFCRV